MRTADFYYFGRKLVMAVHGMHGRAIVYLCGMGRAEAKAALMMRRDGAALMSCEVMTVEKVKDDGSLWRKERPKSGNWNNKKIRQESFVFLSFWLEITGEMLKTSEEFRGVRIYGCVSRLFGEDLAELLNFPLCQ
jgi:hypothetical protein